MFFTGKKCCTPVGRFILLTPPLGSATDYLKNISQNTRRRCWYGNACTTQRHVTWLCCVCPQDLEPTIPTALRSPELSLASFKRQLKTLSSVPAALDCSSGCRVPSSHRRCCDCTASSAPTTNVHQTRLDSTWTVTYDQWTISRYRNRGINLKKYFNGQMSADN